MAPYFKTEPVRTQVHLEGNRLVLTCMAEGSWPLEFKWLHNSRELTKFSLEYRQARPSSLLFLPKGCRGGACAAAGGDSQSSETGRLGWQNWGPKMALPRGEKTVPL